MIRLFLGAVLAATLVGIGGGEAQTTGTIMPYRGVAPAMQDLLAGQIDLLFSGPEQLPLMRAGSVKAYAVSSDARLASAPDIPTFSPTPRGPGFSLLKARSRTQ
jgi:tripartite-type tricarboxylate transporter receptor subunit TctC